jgi:hypothetical protein
MSQITHIQQFKARYGWVLVLTNAAMLLYFLYCLYSNYHNNNQNFDLAGIVVVFIPAVNVMVMIYGLVSSLSAVITYPDARFLRYVLIVITLPIVACLSSVMVIALLQNLFSLICM